MSGAMLLDKCEKCAGSLIEDVDQLFAFISVNCGRRGPATTPDEEQKVLDRLASRVQAVEDRDWQRFWKRRRLSQGGMA